MSLKDHARFLAPLLRLETGRASTVDWTAYLLATAFVESRGRADIRYEGEFYKAYIRDSADSRVEGWRDRFNFRLAVSYGHFQIMGLVALELGLDGEPEALLRPDVGAYYAAKLIRARCQPSARRAIDKGVYEDTEQGWVEAVADAYNTGSAEHGTKATTYTALLWRAYTEAKAGTLILPGEKG